MDESLSDPVSSRLDAVTSEFVDRWRNGKNPKIDDFCLAHPDLAGELRELLPALLMMEDMRPNQHREPYDSLPDNDQLLGDYRIIHEIGRGGMGIVYEAEQISLGRRVALKMLLGSLRADPTFRLRFERESKAAAQLHHSNIVPVFAVGQEDGTSYMVMHLVRGASLDEILEDLQAIRENCPPRQPSDRSSETSSPHASDSRPSMQFARLLLTARFNPGSSDAKNQSSETIGDNSSDLRNGSDPPEHSPQMTRVAKSIRPMTGTAIEENPNDDEGTLGISTATYSRDFYRRAARIGVQVSDALDYAHQQGVLHRDIKPSNLLLDGHGDIWVTDFGLAKATDDKDLTMTGDVLGTLRFMAPERFHGVADARSDIYGLGVTLYELVTLRRAFDGKGREKTIRNIMDGQVSEPSSLTDVPRDLATIILKAMAVDPRSRYDTAGKMADDLKRYIDNRPILSRRATPSELLMQWGRRNPVAAGFALLSICVFVVGFAGVTWKWRDAERHRRVATSAESRTRQLLYVANMNMVQQAWKEADLPRVRALLNRHIPSSGQQDRRGFEWYYWWRLAHPDNPILRHDGDVKTVAFSPDGRLLASGSMGGAIKVWETSNLTTELRSFQNPELAGEQFLQFSPNGKFLASHGRNNGMIYIWDVATWRLQSSMMTGFHLGVHDTLAFLPDSASIASTTDIGTTIWDVQSGEAKISLPGHMSRRVAVSPKGGLLASFVDDVGIVLWDVDTRRIHRTIGAKDMKLTSLVFSPDGDLLATGDKHRTVSIWSMENGQRLHLLKGHQYQVSSIAFSPDCKLLASGSTDTTVVIWNAKNGDRVRKLKGHSGLVQGVAWSPISPIVASSSDDKTVRLWDVPRPSEFETIIRTLSTTTSGISIAISNDERQLAFGTKGNVIELRDLNNVNGEARLIDTHSADIATIGFSCDDRRIATGNDQGIVAVWDTVSGSKIWEHKAHEGRVTRVAYAPQSRHFASSGMDGKINLFDEREGRLIRHHRQHTGPAYDLSFHPTGRQLASAGSDKSVILWEVNTGECSKISSVAAVYAVTFSPDGKLLAFGGRDKRTTLWDLASEQEISKLEGHTWYVTGLSFSSDGLTVASSSHDSSVRLWDVATGEQKASMVAGDHSKAKACFLMGESRTLVSANENGTVRIWRATTAEMIEEAATPHVIQGD